MVTNNDLVKKLSQLTQDTWLWKVDRKRFMRQYHKWWAKKKHGKHLKFMGGE